MSAQGAVGGELVQLVASDDAASSGCAADAGLKSATPLVPVALLLPPLYLLAMAAAIVATARTGDDGAACAIPGVNRPTECVVSEVQEQSPADWGGIRPGDTILAADGWLFIPPDGVFRWFYHPAAGQLTRITVRRAGTQQLDVVPLVLQSRMDWPGVVPDFVPWTLGGLIALVVGAIVIRARPNDPAARLLLVGTITGAIAIAFHAFQYAGPRDPPIETWYWWAYWIFNLGSIAVLVHLFLAFPTRRELMVRLQAMGPGRLRRVGGLTFVLYLPILLGFEHTPDHAPLLQNVIIVAYILVIVVTLFSAYRRAHSALERAQLKWPICALVVLVCVILASSVLQTATGLRVLPASTPSLFIGTIPLAIGISILRYRLFDVEVLINRTLVYGALVAAIVGIYVLVVGYLGLLLQARGDVVSLFAASLVAVLFQPLRQRLQVAVNRLLYGRRDEPYTVLSQLGRRLQTLMESDAVVPTIVETVREALQVPYVALGVRSRDGERIAAESGSRAPIALRIALPYQAEPIGALLVAARQPGGTFGPADRQLLEDVARQAGPAVHAVGLTSELQAARERLVAAREEERRRLRRDLHDGLGPRLASLGLQLAAMRNTLADDPALRDRVESLKQQTQEAVDDVRRVVEGLRPPALDELGLLGALEQYASRYGGYAAGIQVNLDVPARVPMLSAAVEVAAYRIITEALTNVARHAVATSCRIRVEVAGDSLLVEISDDGRGLPADLPVGAGLASMRERAEELGGTCFIESLPADGTRVLARLPVGRGRP